MGKVLDYPGTVLPQDSTPVWERINVAEPFVHFDIIIVIGAGQFALRVTTDFNGGSLVFAEDTVNVDFSKKTIFEIGYRKGTDINGTARDSYFRIRDPVLGLSAEIGFYRGGGFGGDIFTHNQSTVIPQPSFDITAFQTFKIVIEAGASTSTLFVNDAQPSVKPLIPDAQLDPFQAFQGRQRVLMSFNNRTESDGDVLKVFTGVACDFSPSENPDFADAKISDTDKMLADILAVADQMVTNNKKFITADEVMEFAETLQVGVGGTLLLNEQLVATDSVVAQRFILERAIAFVSDKSKIIVREVF